MTDQTVARLAKDPESGHYLHDSLTELERPHQHDGGGASSRLYVFDGTVCTPLNSDLPGIEIPEHWTFKDTGVADGFNRHVREQLPWYDLVTDAIVQIARHYLGQHGNVYDIGASTGNIGRALDGLLVDRQATLYALEESEQMAARWWGPGELLVERAQDHAFANYDVAVLNLVLMFLRPDEQGRLLDKLFAALNPGGAIILVERMLPPSGYLSIVTSRLTLHAKMKAGVPAEEILNKELSIAGSQRPIDARILLARGAVEWFRYGDFAGWVITKEVARHT